MWIGNVLSRGRNKIHERSGEGGTLFGHKLAHAEVNALLKLDYHRHDPRACTLYTTTEPCPLCVGALRMASPSYGTPPGNLGPDRPRCSRRCRISRRGTFGWSGLRSEERRVGKECRSRW